MENTVEKRIMLSPEKKLLSPEYKSWLAQQLTEKMLSRMQTAMARLVQASPFYLPTPKDNSSNHKN